MVDYILAPDGTNIDIPGIKSIDTSYETLNEKFRTIGGYLKIIGIGKKQQLDITTIPISKYEMLNIKNYLKTTDGFTQTIYLEELNAYIDCDISYSDSKLLLGSDKYEISLKIREV